MRFWRSTTTPISRTIYQQHFAGLVHNLKLGDFGALKTDLRYFKTSADGANDSAAGAGQRLPHQWLYAERRWQDRQQYLEPGVYLEHRRARTDGRLSAGVQ